MTTPRERMAVALWDAQEESFPKRVRMKWADGSAEARSRMMPLIDAALTVAAAICRERCAEIRGEWWT